MKRTPPRVHVRMTFPIRRSPKKHGAFTLVELLVCIGLLVLMIAMVTQLTNSTGTTVGNSGKHMDADTQARLIFNRMSVDIAKMVKRTDLDYSTFKNPTGTLTTTGTAVVDNLQVGNDHMAFYAESDGYFSGTIQPTGSQKSAVTLVAYYVANDPYSGKPVLRRMGKGLGWEANSSSGWGNVAYLPMSLTYWYQQTYNQPFGYNLFYSTGQTPDPDYKTVGDQVFRLEYTYLLKSTSTHAASLSVTPWDTDTTTIPAHTSINGFKDVAAIVVTMAILDPTSRVVVTNYSQLTSSSVFVDAVDKMDMAGTWNAAITSPTFASSTGIPKSAAAAVRVYQRYFYLDTQQ